MKKKKKQPLEASSEPAEPLTLRDAARKSSVL